MQDAILRNIHAVVVELFVKTNEVPFIACFRKEARPRRAYVSLIAASPAALSAPRGCGSRRRLRHAPLPFASRVPVLAPGVSLQRVHACEAGCPTAWIAEVRQGGAAARRSALHGPLAGPAGCGRAEQACQSVCAAWIRPRAALQVTLACLPASRASNVKSGQCTAERGMTGPAAALQGQGSARAAPAGLRAARQTAPGGRAGGGRAAMPAEAGPARDHQPRRGGAAPRREAAQPARGLRAGGPATVPGRGGAGAGLTFPMTAPAGTGRLHGRTFSIC